MSLLESRDLVDNKMIVYSAINRVIDKTINEYGKILMVVSLAMIITMSMINKYVYEYDAGNFILGLIPFISLFMLSVIFVSYERLACCQERKEVCENVLYTLVYAYLILVIVTGFLIVKCYKCVYILFPVTFIILGIIVIITKIRQRKMLYARVNEQTQPLEEIPKFQIEIENEDEEK